MTTDKIMVYSEGPGIDKALAETERFAQYEKLGEKDGLYLRLLSEEMLGMVRGITGGFEGQFWLEGGDGECRICLYGLHSVRAVPKTPTTARKRLC